MRPRFFRFHIAFLLLGFVAGAFAQDYDIKLWRPIKAGMKYRVTGLATERDEQALIVSGKTNHTENAYNLDFAAEAEVMEVDSKGQVTKASFSLTNCLKSSQKRREQLFPKGTVIVVSGQKGKTVFSTKRGRRISEAKSKVLSAVLTAPHGGSDDDEIFGTGTRQKVGNAWPVNTAAALSQLEKRTPRIKLSAGEGSTRLVGITKIDGIDCLDLSAELRMKAWPSKLPPQVKIIQSEVAATLAGCFPVDTSRPPLTQTMEMTVTIAASGKLSQQRRDGIVRMTAYRKSELRYDYPAE